MPRWRPSSDSSLNCCNSPARRNLSVWQEIGNIQVSPRKSIARMHRILKVVLYSGLTIVLLLAAAVIGFFWLFIHRNKSKDVEQQVQLSNSAFLRVDGEYAVGPDTGYAWKISYHDKEDSEKVGDWWDGDGGILACPVGKLVVVVRQNGSLIFVRTESGKWREFFMEIPGPGFPSNPGELNAGSTSLELDEIRAIRSGMHLDASDGSMQTYLGQFLPERQELWLDYLTSAKRRFRVRLKLFRNGEKFRLLSLDEQPFDQRRPYFDQFVPDTPVHPACDKIEFFRRTPDIAPVRGTALMIDPQHPSSSLESVEGWRVRKQGQHPDRIYLVLHGELRLIPNIATYKNLFGTDDLSTIHNVGSSFDEIPEGDPISPDAGVWRFPEDHNKLYFFDTGEYHWIGAEVVKQYGFDHALVHDGMLYMLQGTVGEPLGPL